MAVAAGIRLPNIRRIFVPDVGFTICDADLAGADAQVVAWEAGDEKLKSAFRSGVKIHVFNARTMWEHELRNLSDEEIKERPVYKAVKIGAHATNYGAKPPALVANAGWTMRFAEEFQDRWFAAHPEIRLWHQRFERYLDGTQCWNCDNQDVSLGAKCGSCGSNLGRTIRNAFGFRKIYFDRLDGLLPQALAWVPQSTVAFCTELGWTSLAWGPEYLCQFCIGAGLEKYEWRDWLVEPNNYDKWHHITQMLLQVHDSVVFQVRHRHEKHLPEIVQDMRVRVPYADELIIPMGWKSSRVSWGDCK